MGYGWAVQRENPIGRVLSQLADAERPLPDARWMHPAKRGSGQSLAQPWKGASMAYEWRKGHLYYYQKEWRNGTCRSVYAGAAKSEITRLAVQLDQITRTRRALERIEAEDE